MNEQPGGGLMQALAPIASRRPVHLIVSGAPDGALHVVCQPLQVGKEEEPEIARGFSVEATPAELDAELPGHVARSWVPAHLSLQSVLDQVAARTEQARQATLRRQKDGKAKAGRGAKDGAPAAEDAQATLAPPPVSDAAPAAAPAAPAAASDGEAPAAPPTAAADPVPAEPPGDGVSSLFD